MRSTNLSGNAPLNPSYGYFLPPKSVVIIYVVVTVVEVAVVGSVLKLSLEVFLNANLVLILIFLLVEFMAFFCQEYFEASA